MFPDTLSDMVFYTGIPWQSDYKRIRKFSTLTEQANYFNGKTKPFNFNETKIIRSANSFSIRAPIDIVDANEISYMSFINPTQGNKRYYCFVKGARYDKVGQSVLEIELDFWNTFQFDISFKQSYVDRQHGELTYIEDNLSLGQELITFYESITPIYDGTIFVVVVANTDLSDDGISAEGSWTGSPSPMFHYVIPIKTASAANTGYKYGDNDLPSFKELFGFIQKDWANKVVSAYVTKYCGLNFGIDGNNVSYNTTTSGVKLKKIKGESIGDKFMFQVDDKKKFDRMLISIPVPQLTGYNEKLNQYPYRKVMLSTINGQQLELKPEYISSDTVQIYVYGSVGISSKIMYQVANYAINTGVPRDEHFGSVMIDESPNALPIMVDQYAAYIQGHNNSLNAALKASTNDWKTSLKVANRTSDTALASNLTNSLGRVGMGLGSGDLGSALGATVGAGTSFATTAMQGATSIENAGDIGKNNFENLVANQQAMLNDLEALPPSTRSMGGNIYFEYGNFSYGIHLVIKEPTADDKERISNYYDRFGYKVGKYTTINLNSRTTFNYVKTFDCVVTGNLNQSILDVIRRIFNNGVFIYHNDSL